MSWNGGPFVALLCVSVLACSAACGDDDGPGTGGEDAGTTSDGGVADDAGEAMDAGATDAGGGGDDAGGGLDGGEEADAGTAVDAGGGAFVPLIAAGWYHACATRPGGTVVCWGDNSSGQLGDGTTTDSTTPVEVAGLTDVVELAAGGLHTCARVSAGTVYCWGEGTYGQLGDRGWSDRSTPSEVTALRRFDVVQISAGGGFFGGRDPGPLVGNTCFRLADGTLRCTGEGSAGQLGNGRDMPQNAPVEATELTGSVIDVATGTAHSCAILADRTVWCWGSNYYAQAAGVGVSSPEPLATWQVLDVADALDVEATGARTCVVRPGAVVFCWGQDIRRSPSRMIVETPDTLSVPTIVGLGVGVAHTCSLAGTGAVTCWGDNDAGQLGEEVTTFRDAPGPTIVADGAAIAAGAAFTLVARSDGSLVAWGENTEGQLGDGTTTNRDTPVDVMY